MISTMISYLTTLKNEGYKSMTTITLISLQWGIAIIDEAIERVVFWTNIDYSLRESFLKRLFELVYYIQDIIYKGKYKVTSQSGSKQNQQLSHLLKIGKYRKSQDAQYEKETIMKRIQNNGDLYAMSCMFRMIEMTYYFLNQLSQSIETQKELLVTGCYLLGIAAWQMKLNSNNTSLLQKYFPVDYLNGYGILTFRHLAAFTTQINVENIEPLNKFGKMIQTFLCEYILRLLLPNVEVVTNKIKEPSKKITIDLIIQAMEKLDKDIDHPECLWNESTRKELYDAVKSQYEFYHTTKDINESNFANILSSLKYTAHKEEIKVGGLFIRLINKDPYMKFINPTGTIRNIMKTSLKSEMVDNDSLNITKALLGALYNIIIFQKGIDLNVIDKEDIKTLCDFIDPTVDEIPNERIAIYNIVFDILAELTKYPRQTLNIIQCKGFVKLAFYQLRHHKNVYLQRAVIVCMENIIQQAECNDDIVNSGLLLIFLSNGLNRGVEKPYRIAQFRYAQGILAQKSESRLKSLGMIIPKILLEQFAEKDYKTSSEWIEYLDEDRQEILYIWDKELRECVIKGLEAEIAKAESKVMNEELIPWEPPKESYISGRFNKGETVVGDVILTMFIRNPYVKIRVRFSIIYRNHI